METIKYNYGQALLGKIKEEPNTAGGMTLVLEPVFSVDSFVKDMVKYKPNMTVVATSLWLGLIKAKECENIDLANMRYPITGGEKILKAQEIAINDFFKACRVHFHKRVKHIYSCKMDNCIKAVGVRLYLFVCTYYGLFRGYITFYGNYILIWLFRFYI